MKEIPHTPLIQPCSQATSLPLTTFAQNNGVISLTAVASRQAGWACAIILFVFGVLGKVGGLITSIPNWYAKKKLGLCAEQCMYSFGDRSQTATCAILDPPLQRFRRYDDVPVCQCHCLRH